MDGAAIPITTPTVGPLRMDSVVVFGDSLSDIGQKWTTKSGKAAIWAGEMYVNPTGRYSDCRNWTDFMYEAATGCTLIAGSAETTIALSRKFFSLTRDSATPVVGDGEAFQYANYAEGGACGDTPASKGPFLGTFKVQVDKFENDCKVSRLPLGNTLFIIWFGANDLYTAGRKSAEMPQVAQQVAREQRKRLELIVKNQNRTTLKGDFACKFIFVDLCRPLTSVRYTMRLKEAQDKVRAVLGQNVQPSGGGLFQARHTLQQAIARKALPPSSWYQSKNVVELLHDQIEATKDLEQGVLLFNSTLATLAHQQGDRVAEVGSCVSEDTLRRLVQANFRLKAGAMGAAVTGFVTATSYDSSASVQHTTTIDQVHPTDQMYRLIWLEIYEQIRRSNCTFGALGPALAGTPLAELSGPSSMRPAFAEVLDQIETGPLPQSRLKKTKHNLW